LPDEIVSALSYAHSLSIRPSVMTSRYVRPDLDLQEAGREMHVAEVVTGHYLKERDQLQITLEAIDVESNRVIWRDMLMVAGPDMISMRDKITAKVRQGLLPALGVSTPSQGGTRPRDNEAYDLYLRSVVVPHDAVPNREAIAMLERSVGMDPSFAPAWEALGLRYYFDGTFGNGGEGMLQRSSAAYERAIALDSDLVDAASQLIIIRLERGEPGRAYEEAKAIVESHSQSAEAHFLFSFVLRYAGMLEESTHECDIALALDGGNYRFRSCAWAFLELGKTDRARDYVRLDAGSEWEPYVTATLLLREGKLVEAREQIRRMSTAPRYHRELLETCVQLRPATDADRIARKSESSIGTATDPEPLYYQGAVLASCGRMEHALRLLRGAIGGNYCAYSALQADPLLARLRATPEMDQLLEEAKKCQQRFLAQ